MDEMNFKKWLNNQDVSLKMQSDLNSRIKRLERAIKNCDIDEQHRNDKCDYLLSLFENKGINENMKKVGEVDLPVGKYQLSAFKYALNKYINFLEDTQVQDYDIT